MIGVTVYTAALSGRIRFPRSYLSELPLDDTTIDGVLALVTAPVAQLRAWSLAQLEPVGWEFDHLERFPLVELDDGELLVVRPQLILQRFFGWLPAYDVEHGLREAGASKSALTRFQSCLAHLAEVTPSSRFGRRPTVTDGVSSTATPSRRPTPPRASNAPATPPPTTADAGRCSN